MEGTVGHVHFAFIPQAVQQLFSYLFGSLYGLVQKLTCSDELRKFDFVVGRSSNGRTPDSGSGYRGSSPCIPANSFKSDWVIVVCHRRGHSNVIMVEGSVSFALMPLLSSQRRKEYAKK